MTSRIALMLTLGLAVIIGDCPCTSSCAAADAPPPTGEKGEQDEKKKPKPEKVTLKPDHVFELELSATEESRRAGLMGRKKLDAKGGMLFVYPDSRVRTMWMANCVIDIDLLFLDRTGRILRTWAMKAEPPRGEDEHELDYEHRLRRYSSGRPAQFAIEVPAGTIRKLELKPGQTIRLDLVRLKKIAREAEARERKEQRERDRKQRPAN